MIVARSRIFIINVADFDFHLCNHRRPVLVPLRSTSMNLPYLNPLPTIPEALRPSAQLFVWGAGNDGQFGTGPSDDELFVEKRVPKRNRWFMAQSVAGTFGAPGAGIEAIAAGGLHTMFVDENGTVWTCGNNDNAALGRQTTDVPDSQNPGSFVDETDLASYPHPLQSLVDEGFRAVRIAAGDSISGAISTEGELRVWGSFRVNEGLLGFSSGMQQQILPTPILTLPPARRGPPEKIVSVAAGTNHLVVLTTHGSIYTWGAGDSAQLGRRVIERRKIHGTVPEKIILGTRARKATYIASGSYHSFAIDTDGDVWGWGSNYLGQTGTGRDSAAEEEVRLPTKVQRLSRSELKGATVTEVAGGEHHSLFLTSDGKVYACGRAYDSQLGLSDDDPAFDARMNKDFMPEPAQVAFPAANDPIVRISAGTHNSMAISEGGVVYSWGSGVNGELGAGKDEEVKTPRPIFARSPKEVIWRPVEVSCGGQHTLGLFLSS
ncbi:hypothetical protein D9615_004510 [Tricholomella constricta]|uniref:RCC1-like domain-containing protein n=1 Tax=Tricholomella constricta TaxID=117010 RepID=A0A8H5HC32_9AGAR|nr:hypothetical protein D9615_004510 [Tricholomella constricta]